MGTVRSSFHDYGHVEAFVHLALTIHLLLLVSGDIDRKEWRETIEFYLELKAEEAEMHNQSAEHAAFMKNLRAKKLEQLGKKDADAPEKEALIESIREGEGEEDEEFVGMCIEDEDEEFVGMCIDA